MISRIRTYSFWYYQIAGWLAFWLAHLWLMYSKSVSPLEFAIESLDAPVGFALSLLLRQIYRRADYKHLTIIALILYIVFWSAVFTVIWYSGRVVLRSVAFGTGSALPMMHFGAALLWINFFTPVWLGWSSLYFGTKFWLDWEDEKDRAQKAMALAHLAQLQMLRYQLNPHFLFNALNSVRALIQEDKRLAKEMITELSEFLRYSLVHRDHHNVPLREELDAIRHYLSIEKKRFEDKLKVTFNIDRQAEEYPVLSFLIHPLVENAIKYGMKTSPMPLTLHIEAAVDHENLRILITNSGSWHSLSNDGKENHEGTGTGLVNVRTRLKNAYPGRHRFAIEQHNGSVGITIEIFKAAKA
jgi:two-component system LytT family sensor kinase